MLFPKWEKVNSGENNSKNVSSCETTPAWFFAKVNAPKKSI